VICKYFRERRQGSRFVFVGVPEMLLFIIIVAINSSYSF